MSKAVLFGTLKKVEGKKGGIAIACDAMTLDSGSVKDLFRHAQKETRMKITLEPFQEEMLDDLPEPDEAIDDDQNDLFDEGGQ